MLEVVVVESDRGYDLGAQRTRLLERRSVVHARHRGRSRFLRCRFSLRRKQYVVAMGMVVQVPEEDRPWPLVEHLDLDELRRA